MKNQRMGGEEREKGRRELSGGTGEGEDKDEK